MPTQVFYDDPGPTGPGAQLVRWAFCKTPETVADGVTRLRAADLVC